MAWGRTVQTEKQFELLTVSESTVPALTALNQSGAHYQSTPWPVMFVYRYASRISAAVG